MSTELPVYQCHKRVKAFKIAHMMRNDADLAYHLADATYEYQAKVQAAVIEKHKPKVGWYYVQYPDGYESFSPPEAFESGYALVSE